MKQRNRLSGDLHECCMEGMEERRLMSGVVASLAGFNSTAASLAVGAKEPPFNLLPSLPPSPPVGPFALGKQDLTAEITSDLPKAVLGGAKSVANVLVSNAGSETVQKQVTLRLYFSNDKTLDSADTPAADATSVNLKLNAAKARNVKVRFAYPTTDSSSYLLARVDDGDALVERSESNNVAASAEPIVVAPAFVDLSGAFVTPLPTSLRSGDKGKIAVTLTNNGNTPLKGICLVKLVANSVPAGVALTNSEAQIQTNARTVRLNLKPQASKVTRLSYDLLGLSGPQFFIIDVDSRNDLSESDKTNNVTTCNEAIDIVP